MFVYGIFVLGGGYLCCYGYHKGTDLSHWTPVTGAQHEKDKGGEVFAKLSKNESPDIWFMPSVLKQMPEEMRKVCMLAGPLVVDFPDGGPQNGIFSSLSCPLLKTVTPTHGNYPSLPKCLYCDCMQFQVPKYPGSVTPFDHYEFFEVHVHTLDKSGSAQPLRMWPSSCLWWWWESLISTSDLDEFGEFKDLMIEYPWLRAWHRMTCIQICV